MFQIQKINGEIEIICVQKKCAAIDHMHDWIHGTGARWVSMGVASDGSYGIPEGLICGVPVTCGEGAYHRIGGLPIDAFARGMIDGTVAELVDEFAAVRS